MADRFPSLEGFDSGDATGDANLNPTATTGEDFLARERAALGDDASLFASANDNAAFVEDDDDDLLGGGDASGDIHEFQSSFPAIDTRNDSMASRGTVTGTNYPSSYITPSNEPEPEVISQWRERRDLALQERSEKSSEKQTETVKVAQQNIDDFYENYNSKKEKTIAQTRREADEFLKNREDTSAGGTSWERIAKLVNLSGKGAKGGASGTGKDRFRELLMGLKKDERAPGASGY